MSEISRLLKNFFCNIPAAIRSSFWKRDESIVLMDAWFGNKFADNPRFLFQYLSENKSRLGLSHVVWVTRNKKINEELNDMGYESYMIDSKESIYYHKHAKYHIVNNSPTNNDGFTGELLDGYSYGAIRINLWHGIAGKGVKFANNEKVLKYSNSKFYSVYLKLNGIKLWRLLFEQKSGWGNAYYLAQSTEGKRVLESFFRLPESNYILTGYPRICECAQLLKEEKLIVEKMSKYSKTVLYLPTFRTNAVFSFETISDDLSEVLKSNNILWIQKAHSADHQNDVAGIENENCISLDPNFDINVLWPYIDVLVTDYSSCMIEGLALRKKMVFYVPDFEEYLSKDRGLSFDPKVVMCGPKARNIEELKEIMGNLDSIDTDTEAYTRARDIYWKETYDKTLEDIWNDIKDQI